MAVTCGNGRRPLAVETAFDGVESGVGAELAGACGGAVASPWIWSLVTSM